MKTELLLSKQKEQKAPPNTTPTKRTQNKKLYNGENLNEISSAFDTTSSSSSIDWLIDFNGVLIRLGLFYAKRIILIVSSYLYFWWNCSLKVFAFLLFFVRGLIKYEKKEDLFNP